MLLRCKKYTGSRETYFAGVKQAVSGSLGSVGQFERWFRFGDDRLELVEEHLLLCVRGILHF